MTGIKLIYACDSLTHMYRNSDIMSATNIFFIWMSQWTTALFIVTSSVCLERADRHVVTVRQNWLNVSYCKLKDIY